MTFVIVCTVIAVFFLCLGCWHWGYRDGLEDRSPAQLKKLEKSHSVSRDDE